MFALLNVCGCPKKTVPADAPPPLPPPWEADERPRPLVLVQTGTAPVWTEFDGANVRPVVSPETATLKPFEPWPLAEHAAGIVQWHDGLAIAVNRHGFLLIKEVEDGLLELYFLEESKFTPRYTMLKAFTFRGKPAFLLYRDDFFVEHGIPPPSIRVFTVKDGITGLEPVEIPVFSGFPGAEGWDIEDFFTPDGGTWYFKAVWKGAGTGKIGYMRTENLSVNGEEIPFGDYMRAAMRAAANCEDGAGIPELPRGLPPLPQDFVYTAYSQTGGACVAAWEERESWNTGAAGLLFLQINSGNAEP
ncbi:MAG: hypothetical protein LBD44_06755 [Spirochaetaceae bacterium]|nr:hypothetical protein [Spirochaetaceae bacterium]